MKLTQPIFRPGMRHRIQDPTKTDTVDPRVTLLANAKGYLAIRTALTKPVSDHIHSPTHSRLCRREREESWRARRGARGRARRRRSGTDWRTCGTSRSRCSPPPRSSILASRASRCPPSPTPLPPKVRPIT